MRVNVLGGMMMVMVVSAAPCLRGESADPSCAGRAADGVPHCRGTWRELMSRDVEYDIRSEYACARGREPWLAPGATCRCTPPCGSVVLQKKLYKFEGKPTVERVRQYKMETLPADGCGCAACRVGRHSATRSPDVLSLVDPRRGTP